MPCNVLAAEEGSKLSCFLQATHQPLGRTVMQDDMQNMLTLCGSVYKLLCVGVWWWWCRGLGLASHSKLDTEGGWEKNVLAWEVERPKGLQNGLSVFIICLFTLLLVDSRSFTQQPQSTVLPGLLRVSHG